MCGFAAYHKRSATTESAGCDSLLDCPDEISDGCNSVPERSRDAIGAARFKRVAPRGVCRRERPKADDDRRFRKAAAEPSHQKARMRERVGVQIGKHDDFGVLKIDVAKRRGLQRIVLDRAHVSAVPLEQLGEHRRCHVVEVSARAGTEDLPALEF